MMRLLRKEAMKSQHQWAFHGVIIKKGGAILNSGHNYSTIHAEISAIKTMDPARLNGSTLWSVRVSRTGALANARPCEECMEAIRKAKIKTVVYSVLGGGLIKERVRPLQSK